MIRPAFCGSVLNKEIGGQNIARLSSPVQHRQYRTPRRNLRCELCRCTLEACSEIKISDKPTGGEEYLFYSQDVDFPLCGIGTSLKRNSQDEMSMETSRIVPVTYLDLARDHVLHQSLKFRNFVLPDLQLVKLRDRG